MRDLRPPFRFDFRSLISRARRDFGKRVGGVSINLPFFSFNLRPRDVEEQVAREIVIRMADRRVLNASECCDDCIDKALTSLQEIRALLVDKQVELASVADGALYLLLELQLEAVRQFLTFEQNLRESSPHPGAFLPDTSGFHRDYEQRQWYFAALEMLRGHLYRCLSQIAKIANIRIPEIAKHMRYDDQAWPTEVYEPSGFLDGVEKGPCT